MEFSKKIYNCGNIRAAPADILCEWVGQAWDVFDPEIVRKSFLKCAYTIRQMKRRTIGGVKRVTMCQMKL